MKRLCAYCRRVLPVKAWRAGGRQSACRRCDADRRLLRHYRKLGVLAVHKLLERTEQRARAMREYLAAPEVSPSILLLRLKEGERDERD